jgi:exodeoxyribonuclease VII small subunit
MAKKSEKSLEEQLARLDEIVSRLESRETPLEEALTLFEEGLALSQILRERLKGVEDRIRILVEKAEGTVTTSPAPELDEDQ